MKKLNSFILLIALLVTACNNQNSKTKSAYFQDWNTLIATYSRAETPSEDEVISFDSLYYDLSEVRFATINEQSLFSKTDLKSIDRFKNKYSTITTKRNLRDAKQSVKDGIEKASIMFNELIK
jgi:hypothetical protein